MSVICVKNKWVRIPTREEIRNMFENNPDGAGYMFVRDNKVIISKGYADLETFQSALDREKFTKRDVVVYHFRTSTQANRLEMTHPFPLTSKLELCEELDMACKCGIAHDGIIRMTSNYSKEYKYSDTALFITKYLVKFLEDTNDFIDKDIHAMIKELTNSKWALLDFMGRLETIGEFSNHDGLLFSNYSYLDTVEYYKRTYPAYYDGTYYSRYIKGLTYGKNASKK